jgi:thiopurine S-methyltransferase
LKAAFWHERWEANQLGFHQDEVNPQLVRYWPQLSLSTKAAVFVPLCGKSLDLHWLREAGHPVHGVELSPIACRDFFAEAGLEPTITAHRSLERMEAGDFTIDRGDFFDLQASDLARVGAVYDRGSLVALPEDMRQRYANHLIAILPERVSILLLTVQYDSARMKGPPHSVTPSELTAHFGEDFEIERLWTSGPTNPPPRFRERGLEALSESVWRIERRRRPELR